MRIAVLCSERAPGLRSLLDASGFEVVCCLTSSRSSTAREIVKPYDVAFVCHPLDEFYASRGARDLRDRDVREEYDAATAVELFAHRPDAVVLSSYLYLLTAPMLVAFPERIVNVHHSDLTLRRPSGEPRYKGLRAVREAIFAGETETRATSHLVTSALDGGPPLLLSWSFPVAPLVRDALAGHDVDVLKAYAFAHREWMIRTSFGPLLRHTIDLMGAGRVRTQGKAVTIDGAPGPWELASADAEPEPRSHPDTLEAAAS